MTESTPMTLGPKVDLGRRRLLQAGLTVAAGVAGSRLVGDALASIDGLGGRPDPTLDRAVLPAGYDPAAHRWAMACDPSACIGCGVCVEACRAENRVPDEHNTNRTWIDRCVTADDGTTTITTIAGAADGAAHGQAADAGHPTTATGARVADATFVPRLCMQCENPPCVAVCPVGATFRTADGVVLVDERRCIGCGYCVVACPYGARYLVPAGPVTPAGYAGVADKCTFCYHRITRGMEPACVEVCPVGARVFGDLEDPTSPVTELLRHRDASVMKPELGTRPQVFYIDPVDEPATADPGA